MADKQPSRRRCECGRQARVTATPSPWEFDLVCTCGDVSVISWANAAEMLWVVLANVSGGDWTQQSAEWQEAAARWRDNYFTVAHTPSPRGDQETR